MQRWIRTVSLIVLLLPGAAFAADSQQVLLAKIAALQQQILLLQKQSSSQTATTASPKNADTFAVSSNTLAPRVCNAPIHGMKEGDESDEVANLQIFLARMSGMYPEGKVTGYYGPATTRAVQRFQVKYGILGKGSPLATGWGYVGEKTLTLLRQIWGCGGTTSSGWFSATPTHGSAPLSVVFSAQASSTRPLGTSFVVDFGDGSKGNMNVSSTVCNSIAGPCSSIVSIGHRYTKSGNYTAYLLMERVVNSCIAYPQSCPESASGFCPTVPPVCTSDKTSTQVGKISVAVGTVSTVVSTAVPPTLKLINPKSGATTQLGSPFSIDWTSTNAPSGSTVSLSLVRVATNANVGLLASNKSASGSFLWTIPRPGGNGCTGTAVDCIGEIGGGCGSAVCDVEPSVYKIRADLLLGGSTVVQAQSGAFAIGSAGATELSTLSSSLLGALDGTQSPISTTLVNTPNTTTTTSNPTGAMCQYSGVSYADGISLYTTCEDAFRYSCAEVAGKHLTCKAGSWIDDANGKVVSLPGITTDPGNGQGGCVAPWNSTKIGNSQQVPFEPYFTNGVFTGRTPIPLMLCSSGSWMKCSAIGDSCQAYNPSL